MRPRGANRAANAVTFVAVILIGVWILWVEVARRAEQQAKAERAKALEQRAERERAARVVAIPKLPAYQEIKCEPLGGKPQGPRACCVAADQNDNGFAWEIRVDGVKPASAWLGGAGQTDRSNTVRFTMGAANFARANDCSGVLVQIKWAVACDFDPPAETTDVRVALTSGGVQVGKDNKALNARLPLSPAFVAYGGAIDTWGYSGPIPKALINAIDFGVEICVNVKNGYDRVSISEVDITVCNSDDGANIDSADTSFLERPFAVPGRGDRSAAMFTLNAINPVRLAPIGERDGTLAGNACIP